MEIDIRKEQTEEVKTIRFWEDEDGYSYYASMLHKNREGADIEEGVSGDTVAIQNKEHAEMLIKALQKAISLGWLK